MIKMCSIIMAISSQFLKNMPTSCGVAVIVRTCLLNTLYTKNGTECSGRQIHLSLLDFPILFALPILLILYWHS